MRYALSLAALSLASLGTLAQAGTALDADWTVYTIRNSPTYIVSGGSADIRIVGGTDKVGIGTNKINGSTIGQISHLSISRDDDYTRFTAGSGPYVAPYMNIWVQDALGHVAVLANEPSNPEWTGTSEWDTSGANLLTKTVKVFEMEAGFILPAGVTVNPTNGITGVNFSAFADYVITSPSQAYLTTNEPAGSGAPRDLADFTGYGFNWVFGDTLANYVSGDPGYVVSNPTATAAVPLPAAATGGLALLGLVFLQRRSARPQSA